MEIVFATLALTSATTLYGIAWGAHVLSHNARALAHSLDHTNNQASNSHRAHEAVVVEFRRRA